MTRGNLASAVDMIADLREGPKRLRELVLSLAVRGNLVEQRADEEGPAVDLLSPIAVGRSRLGIPVRYPTGVPVDEAPFAIPESWMWVRLGDIGAVVGGGTPSSHVPRFWAVEEGVPWVTPADMAGQTSRFVSRGRRSITSEGLKSSSATLLPAGAVLFSSRAPIGYVAIAANALATSQGFKSCVPFIAEMGEYIYLYLRMAAPAVNAAASGTTFREVSGTDVALLPIPVPPLGEQHRIVARVGELMGLLDRLESARDRAELTRIATRNAAIARLGDAGTVEVRLPAWNRIASWMGDLIREPGDIEALREALLELTLRGFMSVRDETDEPASELLGMTL